MTRVFPALIIVLFILAAVEAAYRRDLHMFLFYAASAVINVVVLP